MYSNWTYATYDINCINDMKEHCPKVWGFVYKMTLFNKKTKKVEYEYIGKKNIYTKRKRKFGKKEMANLKDKRSKKYEYIIKESDWKNYYSSNSFIKENKDKYNITREILMFCTNDIDLKFQEAKMILCSGALEHDTYLNSGFSLRMYGRKIIED